MNDSGSRRENAAELLVMARMAWVIPASKGGTSPHRGISLVPLPGHFNPSDISWVVEYPASQPPLETAPRSNALTLLWERMICSGALRKVFALGAVIFGLLSFFVAVSRCEAQPIAMVTDLVGRAVAVNATTRVPLGILADLPDGTRVELNPGAKMVALYLAASDEYTLSGPATVVFNRAGPLTVSGEAPIRRTNSMNRGGANARINPQGFVQGAMVLRSARAAGSLAPLNLYATFTLEARPEFRWRGVEDAKRYSLQLQDDKGQTLFAIEVDGESQALPEGITLRDGASYIWEIATRSPDGRRYAASGDFRLATADLRALVERIRPARDAEVAERIAFATWLEQAELRDEARFYWQALAAERPESVRLKELARR